MALFMEHIFSVLGKDKDYETVSVTPSYLLALSVNNIILIHKKEQERLNPVQIEDLSNSSLNLTPNLNLTGTPLECPFDLTSECDDSLLLSPHKWLKSEANYTPLTIQEARSILTAYNLHSDKNTPPVESLWVLCDGQDSLNTVLMGALCEENWKNRFIVYHKPDTNYQEISLLAESVKNSHVTRSMLPEEKMTSEVTCIYDIFGESLANETVKNPSKSEQHANVSLEVAWKNTLMRRNVMIPPLESQATLASVLALCHLPKLYYLRPSYNEYLCYFSQSVELFVGHVNSELHPIWLQLVYLHELANCDISDDTDLPCSVLSETGAWERVNQFIDTHINGTATSNRRARWGGNGNNVEPRDTNLHETITKVAAHLNPQYDFTHQLWPLLICCEDVHELVKCWEKVLDGVNEGEIRPYIHPHNATSIAKIIRDPTSHDFTKILSVSKSLQMLLELGVDALTRDYLYILPSLDLATVDQLQPPARNQDFNKTITWCTRMHTILEVFVVIQDHLCLLPCSLYPLILSAISRFQNEINSFQDLRINKKVVFRHLLKTSDIEGELTKPFSSWRLSLVSENPVMKLKTVCHCSVLPIFPHPFAITEKDDELMVETILLVGLGNLLG